MHDGRILREWRQLMQDRSCTAEASGERKAMRPVRPRWLGVPALSWGSRLDTEAT